MLRTRYLLLATQPQFIDALFQVEIKPTDEAVTKKAKTESSKTFTYAERAGVAANPIAKALFATMERKQSNLCCSADVTTTGELVALINGRDSHVPIAIAYTS